MGYRTYHTFTATKDGEDVTEDYIERAAEISGYGVATLQGENDAKWYDRDADMLALSEEFPAVLFRLEGHGEGDADIWVEWYTNGALLAEWGADVEVPYDPPSDELDPRTKAIKDIAEHGVKYLQGEDPIVDAQEFINQVLGILDRPEVVEMVRE